MVKKIDAWQANDGSLHDTQQQAEAQDAVGLVQTLLYGAITGYDYGLDWDDLAFVREKLIEALTKWDGSARP